MWGEGFLAWWYSGNKQGAGLLKEGSLGVTPSWLLLSCGKPALSMLTAPALAVCAESAVLPCLEPCNKETHLLCLLCYIATFFLDD